MQVHLAQEEVAGWFDGTYRRQGLAYLRPPESYLVFLDLLKAEPGRTLLDVACGPGLLLRGAVARGLEAHGVDLSKVAVEMVPQHAPGAAARVGNAEALPFPDDTFDYVTCIGAVERFLDRERALAEMQRVARPGATFCLMVRNARTLRWKVVAELLGRRNVAGHQDADILVAWMDLFTRCGFAIDDVLPDQWFMQRLWRRLRLWRDPHPPPVFRHFIPLRFANEFIFLMRVAP